MGNKYRTGIKKPRSERTTKRFQLGNYRIVTDRDNTEKFYFEGLKRSLPDEMKGKIEIIVSKKVKTGDLVKTAANIIGTFKETWIVFDRDRVPNFDLLIEDAKHRNINVAWSNPCIEIWFMAYYGNMPNISNSVQCCKEFEKIFNQKVHQEYKKNDDDIYRKLISSGDERGAIKIAEKRYNDLLRQYQQIPPSQMDSCTLVYLLIKEIRSKTNYNT